MKPNALVDAARAADPNDKEAQRNAKRAKSPSEEADELLVKYRLMLVKALGKAMPIERFASLVINAIANDPKLVRAMHEDPKSLMGAILMCAILGLEPNTPLGQAYLVAYFEKDKVASETEGRNVYKMRCAFQLGYQGVLLLAYRSGIVSSVDVEAVYKRDYFDYQLGTEKYLKHRPYDGPDQGDVVRYYAVVHLKSGDCLLKVWNREKVLDHAIKFSKSYNANSKRFFGPWDNNFDSMAKKTVLLDCLKYAPKSTAINAVLSSDNSTKSIRDNSPVEAILDQGNEDFSDPDGKEQFAADSEVDPILEIPADADPSEVSEAIRKGMNLTRGSDLKTPEKVKKPAKEPVSAESLV